MPLDPQVLAAAMMRPTARPAQPEDVFTPGQMTGLQYSRDRYNDGTYQVNPGPDPSITSFKGMIKEAPEGGFINYPGFWDGHVMTLPNGQLDYQGALAKALQYEAQTGQKFARYPTLDAANAGEALVHKAMEQDSERVLGWPETLRRLSGGK